jgi:predicted transcriptional regulator
MKDIKEKIIELLEQEGPLSVSEISRILEISQREALKYLSEHIVRERVQKRLSADRYHYIYSVVKA